MSLENIANKYQSMLTPEGWQAPSGYTEKLNKNYQAAYERFSEVKETLEFAEDERGLKLLNELVNKVTEYIRSVTRMELIKAQMFRLNDEQLGETLMQRDYNRKMSHEAVISQLTAMNRFLFRNYEAGEEIPYGGVFSLNPQLLSPMNRKAVADWAGYLVMGLFNNSEVQ